MARDSAGYDLNGNYLSGGEEWMRAVAGKTA